MGIGDWGLGIGDWGLGILVAKATCLDMAELCKFLRQELHMDASAAVNFRRKLIGKNSSVHTTNLRLHH